MIGSPMWFGFDARKLMIWWWVCFVLTTVTEEAAKTKLRCCARMSSSAGDGDLKVREFLPDEVVSIQVSRTATFWAGCLVRPGFAPNERIGETEFNITGVVYAQSSEECRWVVPQARLSSTFDSRPAGAEERR